MTPVEIIPVPLGTFSVPGSEVAKYPGVVIRAPYVVCAYLVRHPEGLVLFDTGIVGDAEAVQRYRPRSLDLDEQLGARGVQRSDIDLVVNCHLHADHAGGNHLFPGTPIVVQHAELEAAATDDYTVRKACLDFPGVDLLTVRGRHELLRGISVVPTPGHSPGHQSLLIETASHGSVLLAGQAFDTASEFALAQLALTLQGDLPGVESPEWMAELANVDLALFAHDLAQWRPPDGDFRGTLALPAW